MADVLSAIVRAASFVLLLQASGIALFTGIFGEPTPESGALVRRIGEVSALLAIAAVLAHHALEAGRMAGELSGILSGELQGIALRSSGAAEAALRIVGLALIAAGSRRASGLATASGVVGATLAVAAFTLSGHTSVSPARWLLSVALTVHVLIAAFWFGALLPLYLATRRDAPAAAKVIARFSAVATWMVPGIFLAGALLAAGLIPSLATFDRPYGELLLVKIGGFALLMALASLNKWRLAPALARGAPHVGAALRRSIAAEYALIVCVLAATAVMTSFFSPD